MEHDGWKNWEPSERVEERARERELEKDSERERERDVWLDKKKTEERWKNCANDLKQS